MGTCKCNFTPDARQEEVVAQECDLILFDDWVGSLVLYAFKIVCSGKVDEIVVGSIGSIKANA
jgi:hypothetical protein